MIMQDVIEAMKGAIQAMAETACPTDRSSAAVTHQVLTPETVDQL